MMKTSLLTLFLAVGITAFGTADVQAQEEEPLRVLYLSGGGYHGYIDQMGVIIAGVTERVDQRIEWTVDFESGMADNAYQHELLQQPNWADRFDAVIYNTCYADQQDQEYIGSIADAHAESGTGAILLHCAMHTFRSMDPGPWDRLMGLSTFHHEREQREFELEAVDLSHPVMADFPAEGWVSPRDELYIVLETFENLVPLATAYGPETERDQVVKWVNTYGNARVVGTSAGHNTEVIGDPVYLDFVANGLLWSVGMLD